MSIPADRERLRAALLARHPWVADGEVGPRAVEAGDCDRCGREARLVTTCGPGPVALGRRCAAELGTEAWCEGHAEQAEAALAALSRLPAEADDVARLWWLATGELRLDPEQLTAARARALPPASGS